MRRRSEIIGNALNLTLLGLHTLSQSFYPRSGQPNRSRRNTVVASDCDPGYGRGYAVAGARSNPAK